MCLVEGKIGTYMMTSRVLSVFLFTNLLLESHMKEVKKFPSNFLFGVSTSAYQIEGAWNLSGKGENVWDQFTHEHPERIVDKSTGDIACDSYHKIEEDVALLKELGVNFYRFSISWSRLLPFGYAHTINPDGLRYYNELLYALVNNGIQPMVTLYHWDLPVPLSKIGGWTNSIMADIFVDYAKVAFTYFGDRVPYWITFNTDCRGYREDFVAPALNNSGVLDYLCGHVTLLAHAKVYRLYEAKFKKMQRGEVGLTAIDVVWYEAKTKNINDLNAAERVRQFTSGWLFSPLLDNGDYPEIMQRRISYRSAQEGFTVSRLPKFSKTEKVLIKGATDFIGLNAYTANLVSDVPEEDFSVPNYFKDMKAEFSVDPKWNGSNVEWLKVVPESIRKMMNWFKNEYNNTKIIITENGYADNGDLKDFNRVSYHQQYLSEVLKAIHIDKVNVVAYSAWSLLDNFEWNDGYTQRFGLYHVDFNNSNRIRTAKYSAKYYKEVISRKKLNIE